MPEREEDNKSKWIVVTTINLPSPTIEAISALCTGEWGAVVVGDVKTPAQWAAKNIEYLSVDHQRQIFGDYGDQIPYRHYSRKNLGYLYAISRGAELILETDDDNIPYPSFGHGITQNLSARRVTGRGWVNVYSYFTDKKIWPRGLPLDEIYSNRQPEASTVECDCPIQQFLADDDPDVDAVYRLIFKEPVKFNPDRKPIVLGDGVWSPFNSQNTLFFRKAFPLLYLPCHVSFRMTDIWRSFVATAALWEHGFNVAFHTSTVRQVRNDHDLLQDFAQEVVGYTENRRIVTTLNCARSNLSGSDRVSLGSTARALWRALFDAGIVSEKEMKLIERWFETLREYADQRERHENRRRPG